MIKNRIEFVIKFRQIGDEWKYEIDTKVNPGKAPIVCVINAAIILQEQAIEIIKKGIARAMQGENESG